MFALLLLLLSGWRYRGKDHAAVTIGVGGLSGFCSGLAQTGGPPIVAYWLGRPLPSSVARANIMLFFAASDVFSVVSYAMTGLITLEAIGFALIVGPVYAAGVGLGAALFGRASDRLFRTICYTLIAAAVIIGLPTLDGWSAPGVMTRGARVRLRSCFIGQNGAGVAPVGSALLRALRP